MLLVIKTKIDFKPQSQEVTEMLQGLKLAGYLQLAAELIVILIVPVGLSKLCQWIRKQLG